jgi:DNA-binding NtrC family response regulator
MTTPSRILLADEEADCCRTLGAVLEKDGHRVTVAPDGNVARRVLVTEGTDLVISDLVIPPLDGFELLRAARQIRPAPPVILVSEYGTIETAVRALKQGAYHYFQKPLDMEAVRATVSEALGAANGQAANGRELNGRALNGRAVNGASRARQSAAAATPDGLGIVGQGLWFDQAMSIIGRVAPSPSTVLLTGESGTGKELFARAVHRLSGRQGPFVAVSCAALSRDLLESELFGHEKGAFTGADRQRPGRFELAHGGTLLLDEIGDVPLDLQVKLLRVLQERQFERVGGTETLTVDVRIVAASNRDLAAAMQARSFREDLYWRLNVVGLHLPPLRERPQDIEPLARHFIGIYSRANGKRPLSLGPSVLQLLQRYPWPGNARELENAIERAVVLAEPGATELDASLLPEAILSGRPALFPNPVLPIQLPEQFGSSARSLHDMDEQSRIGALRDALAKTAGNAARAARLLGVSARSVRYYVDKYGIWRRGKGRIGP